MHGIEDPATRSKKGKPETGQVRLKLKREGAEVLIEVGDDGAGLNLQAIRRKAYEQGLIAENRQISDEQAIELILQPGFSTAGRANASCWSRRRNGRRRQRGQEARRLDADRNDGRGRVLGS